MKIARTSSISDQGQGHCRPSKVSPFTTIQSVSSYNSTLVQARKFKHVCSPDGYIQNLRISPR